MTVVINKPWGEMHIRHQALIRNAVAIYCRWINKAMENSEFKDDDHYVPGRFLSKDYNKYADTWVNFLRERKDHEDIYIELSVSDGDDGGPSILYIHAGRDYHVEKTGRMRKGSYETYEILEYRDKGPNVVAEEPHTVHFEYEELKTVWDDTYGISAIMQEFDTMFSTVYLHEGGGLDPLTYDDVRDSEEVQNG